MDLCCNPWQTNSIVGRIGVQSREKKPGWNSKLFNLKQGCRRIFFSLLPRERRGLSVMREKFKFSNVTFDKELTDSVECRRVISMVPTPSFNRTNNYNVQEMDFRIWNEFIVAIVRSKLNDTSLSFQREINSNEKLHLFFRMKSQHSSWNSPKIYSVSKDTPKSGKNRTEVKNRVNLDHWKMSCWLKNHSRTSPQAKFRHSTPISLPHSLSFPSIIQLKIETFFSSR